MSDDSEEHHCPKCGAEMNLIRCGRGEKLKWNCRPCHALEMRTKYKGSRNAYRRRYQKTDIYKDGRRRRAVEVCGVASETSVYSKRSEKHATQAHQPWGPVEDAVLMESDHIPRKQLAKSLGRSIRALQRRKDRLKKANQELCY